MRQFIRRHKIVSLLFLLPILLFGLLLFYEFVGKPVGFILAHFDQVRGSNRIKVIGMVSETYPDYVRLLDQKHKIKVDRVADCTVTPWEMGFKSGYNSVSVPAIEKKFGNNVFDECYRDAVVTKIKEPGLSEETQRALELDLATLEKSLQSK